MNHIMPDTLVRNLDGERTDFSVMADKKYHPNTSKFLFFLGLAWTAFSSIFVFVFIGPVLMGNESHFKVNGRPVVASFDNLAPLLMPSLIIGVFLLIGFGMLIYSIKMKAAKGGWFVGTQKRLVAYDGKSLRSIDWEQFNGNVTVEGDNVNGNVTLQMRTGRHVSRNKREEYVPDELNIIGIEGAFDIDRLCRQRIKENDPTPANV